MKFLTALLFSIFLVGCGDNRVNGLTVERAEIECAKTNEKISEVGTSSGIFYEEYVRCHPSNTFKWLNKQ